MHRVWAGTFCTGLAGRLLALHSGKSFCHYMEVFLTGGSGTIGQAVVSQLLEDGCKVIALSRSEQSADKLRHLGATVFPGDLTCPEEWTQRAVSCEALVHLGATFAPDMGAVDRAAMFAIRKAARGKARPLKIIYTGGIWLYPAASDRYPLKETTAHAPLPPFVQMSETIRSLITSVELQVSVIHPALVCSAETGPVADLANAALAGNPFKTRATLQTCWPLVEVSDLARLYSTVLRRQGFRLNVFGAGHPGLPVGELVDAVNRELETDLMLQTEAAPEDIPPAADWMAGYGRSQVLNTERSEKLSGWSPEHKTAETLVRAVLQV